MIALLFGILVTAVIVIALVYSGSWLAGDGGLNLLYVLFILALLYLFTVVL